MRERPGHSIRHRLLLLLLASVVAVVAVHDGAAYLEVRRSALDAAYDRLDGVSARLGEMLETSAAQMRTRALATARDTAVRSYLRRVGPGSGAGVARAVPAAPAAAALRRLAGSGNAVAFVELRDAGGRVLLGTAGAPLAADADAMRDAVRHALAELAGADSVALGPFVRAGDSLVYPVVAEAAHGRETLGYLVKWRRVGGSTQSRQQLLDLVGPDAALYLGNTRGAGWTDFARAVAAPPVALPAPPPLAYARPGVGAQLAAARAVAGTPWTLVVETSRARVLAPVRAMLRRLAVVTAVLLAMAGAGAWLLGTRLTRPLAQLADAAAAVSAGDYARRVPVERRDEVGALAAAFNAMAANVEASRERLEADARAIDQQAAELADQAAELEIANQDLADSVEEAVRARDALDAALGERERSAAELDAALGSAPVGFAFFDRDLRYRRVNETLAAFSGLRPADHVGRTVGDVVPALSAAIEGDMRRVLATGECVLDVEVSGKTAARPDAVGHWLASYYPIRTTDGTVLGVGAVVSDRTAYKALEHQFRHAQKMEAVGRLAGGVAHDFNNVLTAIRNYSQFLLEDLDEGDARRDDVGEITKAADRAATLVRQLLAFSRQQVLQPRVLDLNATVGDLAPMLRRLIGAHVQLRTRLDPALGAVRADPGQLEQVLVNLVVNAHDAMPAGGALTIETANAELDADYAQQHAAATPGPYVLLAVSDTGVGMSRETQGRIFEPFFTTKETGKGTGLGLATVYGIVKQSGGAIWVYSEPGHGTTFKVYLPRVAADADGGGESQAPAPAAPGGAETVLLVEDDAAVRAAARRTLSRGGYTVIEASSGEEALAVCAGATCAIDLVVTDLVMPEMGGRELAARLRARDSRTRVLYMSGFSRDAAERQSVLDPGDFFLEKPFTPDGLARKVREALGLAVAGAPEAQPA